MPIEVLSAEQMGKETTVTTSFASVMPFRIFNKGPDYFRKQPEPGTKKLSAVERLEADKAKYVKSQQVATTRQEPVKPDIKKKLFVPPVLRRTPNNMPARKTPAGIRRADACGRKGALNIEILNDLINLCESPLPSPKADTSRGSTPKQKLELVDPECVENTELGTTVSKQGHEDQFDRTSILSGSEAAPRPAKSVTVRRVDVRPNVTRCVRSNPSVTRKLPPPSPAKSRISSSSSRGSPRKGPSEAGSSSTKHQSSLHRSKSDLSDRYSRATADLERFFNYCGLDPEEMENIGVERFTRASSDIISNKLYSISNASSEAARSQRSNVAEEKPTERVPYGISVIERNARVIKWLYGLRQARETQKVSNV
ncbi:protein FAM110B [Latimeria chalumnae]|nr:PREDICTED: protein FAM110A [Latimeria chalumnae]XP_006003233.1 PREDICTED: protein FAM110A [Latimeria chalumnae]XP_014348291.1 PREDICTED: protein FAM110A [Latimeria chalumnae]XP_014348292.1 PREDICTED: protein FAM110A [Latimeria chalumnae]|eukprot:XP_006003232.1 PREDICTED: protein FAM110A [Latimeria chalumnae]